MTAAAELQKQTYDILAKGSANTADLAIKHPIGLFVRLAEAGVTKIEDACSDLSDVVVLGEDGYYYRASGSRAWKIEDQ